MCLLSPACVAIGANIMSLFEAQGLGINAQTLRTNPNDEDTLTLAKVYGMLILDSVIYAIITWSEPALIVASNHC
jgi:hypothetical protein